MELLSGVPLAASAAAVGVSVQAVSVCLAHLRADGEI